MGICFGGELPESGEVRVTLPYPQGAPEIRRRKTTGYIHVHGGTSNGHKAGEIEECPLEKINEGLVVTLHWTFPVMIAWTPVDETAKPTAEPTERTDCGTECGADGCAGHAAGGDSEPTGCAVRKSRS